MCGDGEVISEVISALTMPGAQREGHHLLRVVLTLSLWALSWPGAESGSPGGECEYSGGGGGVLTVTITDPLTTAWGYYVSVERADDWNILYEDSRLIQRSPAALIYEVNGIPAHEMHTYNVLVRAHGRNTNQFLGGYHLLCVMVLPPPASQSGDDNDDYDDGDHDNKAKGDKEKEDDDDGGVDDDVDDEECCDDDNNENDNDDEEEGESDDIQEGNDEDDGDTNDRPQAREDDFQVIIIVLSGLVTLCFMVCLAVSVTAWLQRQRSRRKHPPENALTSNTGHGEDKDSTEVSLTDLSGDHNISDLWDVSEMRDVNEMHDVSGACGTRHVCPQTASLLPAGHRTCDQTACPHIPYCHRHCHCHSACRCHFV